MALLKAIESKIASTFNGNSDLLLIKLLLFTYYGGTASVFPYLAVHMKQIGITVQETAIIHAMLPVAMFVGPPVAGFIADKFGGHRMMLIVSLIFTGLLHTSLLWVPQVQSGANLNGLTSMSCEQAPDGRPSAVHLHFRVPRPGCSATKPVNVTLSECIQRCHEKVAYSLVNNANDTHAPIGLVTEVTSLCEHGEFCVGYDVRSGDYEILQTSFQEATNSTGISGRPLAAVPPRLLRFHPPDKTVEKSCLSLFGGASETMSTMKPEVVAEQDQAPGEKAMCMLACNELDAGGVSHLWAPSCGSSSTTFWVYFFLRVVASAFMSCCFCLFDTTTMFIVSRYDTDYGKQRVWPILATAIFPPITGYLVHHFSALDGVPGVINYHPPFLMLDALLLCTTIMLMFGGLDIRSSSSNETNLKSVGRLLKNPRIDLLIISVFLLGTLWGYVEVFLYWFLMELGSPTYLLGLTLTVGSGIGIPVLFFSERIINRLGNVTILFAAFIFYAIRYLGYSFIYNPWWCLIFEAMEIFTVHLMWVSVITHTSQIVPKGLLATMQGVMGGTHYGFGRGSGSLFGGLLMGAIGARRTFRLMGIAAVVAGLIYLFVEKVAFRALPNDHINCTTEQDKEIKGEHIMKNGGTKESDHEQKSEKV